MNAPLVGLVDYKNGTKDNWRRWQWNQIAARVRDRRNAVVLYLASDQDLDRRVAVSKGFNPNNLIAVDIDQSKVDRLRAAGKLAICGDLCAVLSSWSASVGVDAVVADFCCGWSAPSDFLLAMLAEVVSPMKNGGVIAINMQRGRDAYSNDLRRQVSEQWKGIGKHRGELFIAALISTFASKWRDVVSRQFASRGLQATPANMGDFLFRAMSPTFGSYRGRRVIMDSVVFQIVAGGFETFGNARVKVKSDFSVWREHYQGTRALCEQVAAVLATRTRRINGDLPRCPDF